MSFPTTHHFVNAVPLLVTLSTLAAHLPEEISVLVGLAALYYYYLAIKKMQREEREERKKNNDL